jgi:glycosyltransferase involved in cell wall biosynthesis
MKILIIPSWYPTQLHPESGSFFRDRAQILKKSGMDIVVAAPVIHSLKDISGYFNTKSDGYFLDGDLPIYKFEFFNIFPKLDKRQYYRYKKITVALFNRVIKDRGMPDIVFVHSTIWAGAALVDVCRQYKIPIVISEHLKEFLHPGLFSQFQQTLIETTYQSCSSIISTSTALRNSIVRSFPQAESKISIIPNPVDEDVFVLKPNHKENENTSILCISLFRSEKRIDLVIQSFYERNNEMHRIEVFSFSLWFGFKTKTSSSTGFGIIEIFDSACGNERTIEFRSAVLVEIMLEQD